ncbi:hypothetical protein [Paractinoplanes durhamensis]|uniref:Uncharacterized protein n=1 Tax=Paractinoplanes durhamensis TaxID=113563 RepID=A0ABQ3YP68_9ACTN|nr:hypothetical protein [Actinoplanes durhamensis]GID99369.1 hypothetical protein Adu01nite_07200 [Actinoplanes durhamensis]
MLKKWWTPIATLVMLAAVLVVATTDQTTVTTDDTMVMVGGHGRGDHGAPLHFTLTAKPVHGLYPGKVEQLRVTVNNPTGYRLRLQQLSGRVTWSSRRGCPATSASLQVRQYTGRLPMVITARGRTDLGGSLPVVMPSGTSEKCAGARFTITISGMGYRVDR